MFYVSSLMRSYCIYRVFIKAITKIKELTTQIYFRDHIPPAYEDYVIGRDTQYPKRILYYPSGRLIEFDIVLDYWNIIGYKQ